MASTPDFPTVNDPSLFGYEDDDTELELEEQEGGIQQSSTEPQRPAQVPQRPPSTADTSNIGEVESNVPVPKVSRRKYPFDKMNPDVDSFEVVTKVEQREKYGPEGALKRLRSSLSSSANAYAKRVGGVRPSIHRTGDHSLRCWLVSK